MGWFRDFTNFIGITSDAPARSSAPQSPPTVAASADATEIDTIIVIGKRRQGGLFGWIDRNIISPVGNFITKDIPRIVTQDIPRIVTQDIPRIVTRDIPAMASAAAKVVDDNVIKPYVAPALAATDTILTAQMQNPYTRMLMMTSPVGGLAMTLGTEEGRNGLGAFGYGVLHDALGQGLPALGGAVVDTVVGTFEAMGDAEVMRMQSEMQMYGIEVKDPITTVRAPWHRLTGNAHDSFMQTWEKWGDNNLGEWLTYPVGLSDLEYRTKEGSFWDIEVSRDNERSWAPVTSGTEHGLLIAGNIADPTNLIGIGLANKVVKGGRIAIEVAEHSDDIVRAVRGATDVVEHADDAGRTVRSAREALADAAGKPLDVPPVPAAVVDVAEEGVERTVQAAAGARITTEVTEKVAGATDDVARAGDDAARATDDVAAAGDDVAAAGDDVAAAADDVADGAPTPRSRARTAFRVVTAPVRVAGSLARGILRDPYSMTELSMYAIALGGPMIREHYFQHAAMGDLYTQLQDPHSLDGKAGEQRLIDTLNLIYAKNATLTPNEGSASQPTRLASLDRDGGLLGDTGAFAATGEKDTAVSRLRFVGLETFGAVQGEPREVNVATRRQELGLQIAYDGFLQRYLANPNTPLTRSEILLSQMMLAREGLGEGTMDEGKTKASLNQYIEDNGLTAATLETRRNGYINERTTMERSRLDEANLAPAPPAAGPALVHGTP